MSAFSSAFCLSTPSAIAPTATAFSIENVLATGEIAEVTGRLISLGSLRLLATPNRTVRIDGRTVFATKAEAVAAARDAMRLKVQELERRRLG